MMLRNYTKVAARNLWKNKGFSAINIFGLALGIACSLLIFLWIQDEKNVNAFHQNSDRIYQVYERQYYDGKVNGQYYTPGLLAVELKKQIPEIEMSSGLGWGWTYTFNAGTKTGKQYGMGADSDFFRIFSYPLIEGSATAALRTPESIAISHSMANYYFGSPAAAINKTLRLENKKDLTVTTVFEDITGASSEKFDYLYNWATFIEMNPGVGNWSNHGPSTFVLLRKGTDKNATDAKIKNFIEKFEDDRAYGFHVETGLQLFKDVYLHSHFENGIVAGGRIEYVHLFSLVAIFLLLIACINFMNLTTARSVKRAKEIGVRKVIGAGRGLLIRQFMGEAILIAFIAACLALILVTLALPFFNQLTGKQMKLPIANYRFAGMFALLIIATGVLSGSYPAIFLSRFNPARVLKGGSVKAGPRALWFRQSLVVFQFVLSIVLITSTILISRQVSYVQDINLGYDRENLVYIDLDDQIAPNLQAYINEAGNIQGIAGVSPVNEALTSLENSTMGVKWPGKPDNYKPAFAQISAGFDFIKTMKLQIVQGRSFSREYLSDSTAYIVNESAVRKMGFTSPVGHALKFWGVDGRIIGVVKDFHFQSMHENIRPLIIRMYKKKDAGLLLVRIQPGHTKEALSKLESVWKSINPLSPFTFRFSSEEYTKLYKSEQVVKGLSEVFAILAIAISCLGLLGLSMFTAEQRTKEFGIRKVLGAGFITMCSLLSFNFLILVCIAFAIAAPLAWWGMHVWLQQYAYHTDISWYTFALAGGLAILIAQATICFQAIKVARANPLKSLKTE